MGKNLIVRAASAGAFAACSFSLAEAQDGGLQMTLGFDQRFEVTDNLELDPVNAGTTSAATTTLRFGLFDETPQERFALTASTAWRAVDGPNLNSGLDDQRLGLSYGRDGADAGFGISGDYRRASVEFLRPLEDFINEDGDIELPDDLDDLEGTGIRETYGLDAAFDFGRNAPVGASFTAGWNERKYSDGASADLNDTRSHELGAEVHLRFSAGLEGTISTDFRHFEADDAEATDRDTLSTEFGLRYAVSPVLTLDGGIGYTTIDTTEFGLTDTQDGVTGRLKAELEMANGTASAEVSTRVTQDGELYIFELGRSLDLPAGQFAATFGVTDSDSDDPAATGSLDWRQETANGLFSARLRRSVTVDDEDGNVLATALSLGYSHELTALSGLDFNVSYTISDRGADTIDRANLSAAYRHSLTEDWGLQTGYRYRLLDDSDDGRAESHALFLSLGRDFNLRP